MDCQPLVTKNLLDFRDLSLFCHHFLLLLVSALNQEPKLLCLLLPFNSFLLKGVYWKLISDSSYLVSIDSS